VTLRWESGIGNLAQDTLTMTLEGTASGCGQSLAFTVTFTGRLLAARTAVLRTAVLRMVVPQMAALRMAVARTLGPPTTVPLPRWWPPGGSRRPSVFQ